MLPAALTSTTPRFTGRARPLPVLDRDYMPAAGDGRSPVKQLPFRLIARRASGGER